MLIDLPEPPLIETIPDFHNVKKRLERFNHAVKMDAVKRVNEISKDREFINDRAKEMERILTLGKEGRIPLRITHNDTKFNNILFDQYENALCIIDLDTVMPGYVHYDFGDAIRTGANTGAEDERDLTKVSMNIHLFEAYTSGFLEETGQFLSEEEIKNLPFSAKLMTFIMGLRFLTDYIEGDQYYKIDFDGHNLQRARAQFKLLKSIEEQYLEMKVIVTNLASL
jgi:Ser/Thr protein kinase RdoA (MazF antagonist)